MFEATTLPSNLLKHRINLLNTPPSATTGGQWDQVDLASHAVYYYPYMNITHPEPLDVLEVIERQLIQACSFPLYGFHSRMKDL